MMAVAIHVLKLQTQKLVLGLIYNNDDVILQHVSVVRGYIRLGCFEIAHYCTELILFTNFQATT